MNSSETLHQRLKEFSYYMTESLETYLKFCLDLLDEKSTTETKNSARTSIASSLLSGIPYVGEAVSGILREGEVFFLDRVNKKNSRTLADLVYYYRENKSEFRQVLIKAGCQILSSYKCQFLKVTCDGGPTRAMMKLGKDAADRIFNYLVDSKPKEKITEDDITKGVIFGDKKKLKQKSDGRALEVDGIEWKTTSLFKKTGIFIPDEGTFYVHYTCQSDKYGFRVPFPWEDLEAIKKTWEEVSSEQTVQYTTFQIDNNMLKEINNFISRKDPVEEAKLERLSYHEDSKEDREKKKQQILDNFNAKFQIIMEEFQNHYNSLRESSQQHEIAVGRIEQKQEEEVVLQRQLHGTLRTIQKAVEETSTQQSVVVTNTETIKKNVDVIITKQEEYVNEEQVKQIAQQTVDENQITPGEVFKPSIDRSRNALRKANKDADKAIRKIGRLF